MSSGLVKRLVAPLMLSAAIISGFSGCTTVSPWTNDGITYNQIGTTRRYNKYVGEKIIKEKKFDISNFSLVENQYIANVTESSKELIYDLVIPKEETPFEEVTWESQTTETNMSPIFIFLGATLGILGGALTAVGRAENKEENQLYMIGGGLVGGLVGCLIKIPPEISTKKREAGRERKTAVSMGTTEELFAREKMIYQNRATGIIHFGVKGVAKDYTTIDGTIRVGSGPNEYFTKEELAKGLKNFPLMQQVKSDTRNKLEKTILGMIPLSTAKMTLETRETSYNPDSERVVNGSRTANIESYKLNDGVIYSAVKQFVQEEINPKIKPLKFRVEDDLTHTPIRNSIFKFNVSAPSQSEVAGDYFTGNLKDYAAAFISNYLIGASEIDCFETITVPTYCPSKISVEVINPNYNFVLGNFEVKGAEEKVVYMVDKGQKVRIDNQTGSVGRIK